MRVAYFHDAPRLGGAERYLLDLCRGAAADGAQIEVITPDSPLVDYLRDGLGGAATVQALPPRTPADRGLVQKVAGTGRIQRRLRSALRRLGPDLLHINNGGYPGSHLARLAAYATSAPRVMTVHAVAQERAERLASVAAALDGMVWRRMDAVICGTETAGEQLVGRRGLPREKLRTIAYGVPEARVDADEVEGLHRRFCPDGQLMAGMVVAPDRAADVRFKGHDVLLDAMGAVERGGVRAVMVGHDPGPGFRERAADRGLSESISVIGRVPAIAPFMAAFDVLIVPSTRYESLPLVVLEAMAAGTPVIASRLSGIPEAVVDDVSGYLFEPGDSQQLAGLLEKCAGDPAGVRRLGEGARRLYEARFGAAAMVEATLGLYRQVLSS